MSFKAKKWGCVQTITPTSYIPTLKSQTASGGSSRSIAWGGKVLFLTYTAADTACWVIYDPVADSWSGPFYPPITVTVTRWQYHNPLWGDEREFKAWGGQWLLSYGMSMYGYHIADFYGWDADLNFVVWTQPTIPGSTNRGEQWVDALGVDPSGNPTRTLWQWWNSTTERLVSIGPGGTVAHGDVPYTLLWYVNQGVTLAFASRRGNLWQWYVGSNCVDPNNGSNLYAGYVTTTAGNQCSPLAPYTCDPRKALVGTDGGCYGTVTDKTPTPDTTFAADLRDPLTAAAAPWASTWAYRRDRDAGTYVLYQGDLSGVDHGIGGYPVQGDVTLMANGLYLGLGSEPSGFSATIHKLDPSQPALRTQGLSVATAGALAWAGTYAIGRDLRARNVLDPTGGETPSFAAANTPVDQRDGKLLTQTKVYGARTGSVRSYVRDVVVELRGYPTSDPDWWWPGDWVDASHYQGFWWLFADAGDDNPVIEYMPDPGWGLLGLVGQRVDWGMGKLHQDLEAGAYTHYVSNADKVSGAYSGSFWGGTSAGLNQVVRRLQGYSDAGVVIASKWYANIQSQPYAECRIGSVATGSWVEIKNLRNLPDPGLGEDGGWAGRRKWNPWWAAPIPACLALPDGGWLVGATLYFAPWGQIWAWDAGSRDATFRSSGQGWVPAIPGADGPCYDYHPPKYFTDLDEWTVNRSLYGPDALLVYDANWNLVECLSDATMYPANGKAFMVTQGAVPKIIYQTYHQGTYSDYAEAWGQVYDVAGGELNMPMYVCYDLMSGNEILPGAGAFRGFVNLQNCSAHINSSSTFPWTALSSAYQVTSPKGWWSAPGHGILGPGRGGRTVTLLGSRNPSSRQGTKGVGQRA